MSNGTNSDPLSFLFPPTFPIADFVGPGLLAAFFQAIETGIIFNQFLQFWSRSESESNIPKACVLLVTSVSILQTCLTFYNVWQEVVENFGNIPAAISIALDWPIRLIPLMNIILSGPVQVFLVWRCWLLTNHHIPLFITVAALYIASVAAAISETYYVFTFDYDASNREASEALMNGTPPPVFRISPIYVCYLAFPAALDIILTATLLNFLIRSKSAVLTRRFRKTLDRLIDIIWEAALPPCVCSIAALISYLTLGYRSFWNLLFLQILSQLYVIAYFFTLDGFHTIKNGDPIEVPPTVIVDESTGLHNRSRSTSNVLRWKRGREEISKPSFVVTVPNPVRSGSLGSRSNGESNGMKVNSLLDEKKEKMNVPLPHSVPSAALSSLPSLPGHVSHIVPVMHIDDGGLQRSAGQSSGEEIDERAFTKDRISLDNTSEVERDSYHYRYIQ